MGCCGESCMHISEVFSRPIKIFQHRFEKLHAQCGKSNYQYQQVNKNSHSWIFQKFLKNIRIHSRAIQWFGINIQIWGLFSFQQSDSTCQAAISMKRRTIIPYFDTFFITIPKSDKQDHFRCLGNFCLEVYLTFLRLFEAMSWSKAQSHGLHYTLTYFWPCSNSLHFPPLSTWYIMYLLNRFHPWVHST